MTLEIITSDALDGVTHGFFTRKGGASSGIFHGLNCGMGSSDQADVVTINRSRVADAMDVSLENLNGCFQIHSADVVVVGDTPHELPKADALVSNTVGQALYILTADCQPVLFADQEAGVIGAAHAGWKGAIGGILEATVEAMVDLGANRNNIAAVIGPTISQEAYEVGPEFYENFCSADETYSRFFSEGAADRYQFDLPSFGLHKLGQSGVKAAHWTGHCTYSDPDSFYSYRRSVHRKEADYGRLLSAIRL